MSAITQFSLTISRSVVTLFFTIPCVSRHSVFDDNLWVNSDSVFGDNSGSVVT